MVKRIKLTRRFPAAMTEDGYRRLKKFAAEVELSEGEAMSFLFENLASVTNHDTMGQRLNLFKADLAAQKQ